MSVYTGSDYTESNCYDKKQVGTRLFLSMQSDSIGVDANISLIQTQTNQFNGGFYTQQQAIVHLFEWHWDWIADECEKVKEIPKRVVASREALYVIMRQNNCFLTLWRQRTN